MGHQGQVRGDELPFLVGDARRIALSLRFAIWSFDRWTGHDPARDSNKKSVAGNLSAWIYIPVAFCYF